VTHTALLPGDQVLIPAFVFIIISENRLVAKAEDSWLTGLGFLGNYFSCISIWFKSTGAKKENGMFQSTWHFCMCCNPTNSAFLNPNYCATRFFPQPIIFGHWTAKNSPLKPILPSSLLPVFQHRRFEDFFRSYVSKKFLMTKFVLVKQRNMLLYFLFWSNR
jgi:hypothetical protein